MNQVAECVWRQSSKLSSYPVHKSNIIPLIGMKHNQNTPLPQMSIAMNEPWKLDLSIYKYFQTGSRSDANTDCSI